MHDWLRLLYNSDPGHRLSQAHNRLEVHVVLPGYSRVCCAALRCPRSTSEKVKVDAVQLQLTGSLSADNRAEYSGLPIAPRSFHGAARLSLSRSRRLCAFTGSATLYAYAYADAYVLCYAIRACWSWTFSLLGPRLFLDHIGLLHKAHGTCASAVDVHAAPRRQLPPQAYRHGDTAMPSSTKRPCEGDGSGDNDSALNTPQPKIARTDAGAHAQGNGDFSGSVKKKIAGSTRTGQACDRCKVWATQRDLPDRPFHMRAAD